MPEYLLRFEITNLKNTLFDVQDISSIRGSSYAALQAPKVLKQFLDSEPDCQVEMRFEGGSQGIYRLITSQSREQIEQKIRQWWATTAEIPGKNGVPSFPYNNLQCVVAVIDWRDGDGEHAAILKSEAHCKWRQFDLPSVILIDRKRSEDEDEAHRKALNKIKSPYCDVDQARPVTNAWAFGSSGDTKYLSRHIYQRRNYGAKLRPKEIYGGELGEKSKVLQRLEDTCFTDSFEYMVELSHGKDCDLKDNLPISLLNKMAVVQFDLNNLGALRRQQKSIDSIAAISRQLQSSRKAMLEAVLDSFCDEDHPERWIYEHPKNGKSRRDVRFETLVWGSDEVSWVLPAWLVWDFMKIFFRYAEIEFTINNQKSRHAYSGGIVICNRRMPIRQAVSLAEELRDSLKAGGLEQEQSAVQIEILESFDIPDDHLETHRKNLFGAYGQNDSLFTLRGEKWDELTQVINKLKAGFPRSKLRQILADVSNSIEGPSDLENAAGQADSHLSKVLESGDYEALSVDDFQGALAGAGNNLFIALYNLDRFWDYVNPFGDSLENDGKGEAA